jgi:hypothetical protein
MTDKQKPRRDIDTLKESIRIDWADLAFKNLTADERKGLREHIEQCSGDLNDLLERPDRLPPVQRFDEEQGVSALRGQS